MKIENKGSYCIAYTHNLVTYRDAYAMGMSPDRRLRCTATAGAVGRWYPRDVLTATRVGW